MTESLSASERALAIAASALEKKALAPMLLDLCGLADFTDYFLIIEGTSRTHVQALAEGIRLFAKHELNEPSIMIEGIRSARWVLVDLGDIVIHIFDGETRGFYDLEGMWADAPRIDVPGAEDALPAYQTGWTSASIEP